MAASKDIRIQDCGNGHISLTIDRAHKHNALSRTVLAELGNTVAAIGHDPDTRLITLQGAGDKYFAAGGDLVDLSSVRTAEQTAQMSTDARSVLDQIRHCSVPVIACLNGDAIGGGAELALACDMRVMTSSARIGFIHAKLAITPAWGGATDLCALIGTARALRMMTRCEMIGSEQAMDWGLADATVSDGFDGTDMAQFLKPMLARSNPVIRALKRQTNLWRQNSAYVERREQEQQTFITTWIHDDHWTATEGLLSKEKK